MNNLIVVIGIVLILVSGLSAIGFAIMAVLTYADLYLWFLLADFFGIVVGLGLTWLGARYHLA